MDPDPEPYQQLIILLDSVLVHDVSTSLLHGFGGLLLILFFLVLSGLFSSSENAFFSLNPNDLVHLNLENTKQAQVAIDLINEPDRRTATRRLLATILLMNNFVNVFIVIFSSWFFEYIFSAVLLGPQVTFFIQVLLITFLLVLLGEIIPKIYATQNNLKIIKLMARPLNVCFTIFKPIILMLAGSSSLFDKYLKNRTHNISMEELNQAIDIADEDREIEEKHILKGIINFGNTSVKQIMKPRTDVACIDISTESQELMKLVSEWGYSRIPIFEENFDNVKGILYIKDLLPYLHSTGNIPWQKLLRNPLFVPENKKIDDLLEDFQEKRIHMAIVVDEYGGTSGIVTMEDILEEVFGEIRDEFDDDELVYSQLDDNTYVFEGKTSLNDIARTMNFDSGYFDDVRNDSDTLAGLIMDIQKGIPAIGDKINHEDFTFTIESADNRRIKRVKVKHHPPKNEHDEDKDDED